MVSLLIAAATTFVITIVLMPFAIRLLRRWEVGEFVDQAAGNTAGKLGIPTMGGAIFLLAVVVGYVVAHVRLSFDAGGVSLRMNDFADEGWLALGAFLGMGLIGVGHDYARYVRKPSNWMVKPFVVVGHLAVAGSFAAAIAASRSSPELAFARGIGLEFEPWLYVAFVMIVVVATTNAVRVSDGMDGFVAGSGAAVFGAYVLVGFWQFRNPGIYGVDGALGLAILAAALVGATGGFLWWNGPPAGISMGGTGSHALGGALAALALLTNTHLLLLVFGAVYFLIAGSIVLQVVVFRALGKRVLRMAPLPHHFEMGGWSENTVIVRFWILTGITVAAGVGMFYADWAVAAGGGSL
jgi:phospho-N-acetylmuramoyl-pentapeptide-transferase